ncbi:MAG: copper homeostasis protein CutC [Tissierellia bacterium]|nr:copper homeostasis protein CutC [Tissierellia bacterium]
MILEVCVDSLKSLKIAKEAGADRIELCSALNIGGLTPSFGLMCQAKEIKDIEIFVMIRPRSGDFLYTDEEFETMKKDIEIVKKLGFDGIVTGILKESGNIDLIRMKEIADFARPLKVALHRAFDDALEPEADIDCLIDIGIIRILTSGQKKTASLGADYIAKIQKQFGDRIEIMPGAGINAENIERLHNKVNCKNYHMSGKVDIGSQMIYKDYIERMETPKSELIVEIADYEKIKAVRDILDSI